MGPPRTTGGFSLGSDGQMGNVADACQRLAAKAVRADCRQILE